MSRTCASRPRDNRPSMSRLSSVRCVPTACRPCHVVWPIRCLTIGKFPDGLDLVVANVARGGASRARPEVAREGAFPARFTVTTFCGAVARCERVVVAAQSPARKSDCKRGDQVDRSFGINGFGRIGRNFLRSLLELEAAPGDGADIELVAINDLVSSRPTCTSSATTQPSAVSGSQ